MEIFHRTAYAAPEVIQQKLYDAMKSDVWSLGVVCFIMLYGTMPFTNTSVARLLKDQLNRNYRVPEIKMQKLSPASLQVIEVLLQPDPEERHDINQVYNLTWLRKYHIEK